MSRRCCCDCLIFEDEFNRTDNNIIGGDWTEAVGNWRITNNKLEFDDATGQCITVIQHRLPIVARVKVPDPQLGVRYRLIGLWEDSSNYWCVEYEQTVGPDGEFRLIKVSGGGETILDSSTGYAGLTAEMWICHTGECVSGTISPGREFIWADDKGRSLTTEYQYGVGVKDGTGSDVYFDDFELWKHKLSLDECPECICRCGRFCPPKGPLTLTFVDCTGTAFDCLEGVTIPLTLDSPHTEIAYVGSDTPYCEAWGGQLFDFKLHCAMYECEEWILCCPSPGPLWGQEWEPVGPPCKWRSNPVSCTCNPFMLYFGPFTVSDSQGNGTYNIRITA